MAIYRGLSGVNREIKEQHRGLGGVNRKIKEQHRGFSGVNRLVFRGKTYLYNEGDEYVDLTGGWTSNGYSEIGKTVIAATKELNYIKVKDSADSATSCIIGTQSKINVTPYAKLFADVFVHRGYGDGTGNVRRLGVYVRTDKIIGGVSPIAIFSGDESVGNIIWEIDVSGLSGEYYLYSRTYTGPNALIAEFDINKIWLE